MISSPIWLSRLPVGSSASRMPGRPTMARAMATRCCWPPESWVGKWCDARGEPHAVERRQRRLPPLLVRHLAVEQRDLHVVHHREVGHQVELLEDEPDPLVAHARELAVAIAVDRLAVERDRARARLVEQPHQVEQRALAAARGAHDRDELALPDLQVDVVQRRRLDALGAVLLADLLQVDHMNSP